MAGRVPLRWGMCPPPQVQPRVHGHQMPHGNPGKPPGSRLGRGWKGLELLVEEWGALTQEPLARSRSDGTKDRLFLPSAAGERGVSALEQDTLQDTPWGRASPEVKGTSRPAGAAGSLTEGWIPKPGADHPLSVPSLGANTWGHLWPGLRRPDSSIRWKQTFQMKRVPSPS